MAVAKPPRWPPAYKTRSWPSENETEGWSDSVPCSMLLARRSNPPQAEAPFLVPIGRPQRHAERPVTRQGRSNAEDGEAVDGPSMALRCRHQDKNLSCLDRSTANEIGRARHRFEGRPR